MSLVKETIEEIIKPLTHVCNVSFRTGIFPDQMKVAKVIPLFKAGNKNDLSNYRPVSLLPQFSKILEKLFVKRLDSFINTYNILIEQQYGFQAKQSTGLAIMKLVDELSKAIDDKRVSLGVFIDLKKAFDTINHDILLKKLFKYGVRGVAYSWICSYINNRTQFVSVDGIMSSPLKILCGVPQGSVLGPKLFVLYLNDLCRVSCVLKPILFADDTNFFYYYYSGKDLKDIVRNVEREMERVKKWFDINRLSLNMSKTKFMIWGENSVTEVKVRIGVEEIERV